MTELVIGIDPDSEAHGVAMYENKKLVELKQWPLMELHRFLLLNKQKYTVRFAIENVLKNTFIYRRNEKANKQLNAKVGISVGRCQQAQMELMRLLDHHHLPYVLIDPTSGNWSINKLQFERVTGWKKQSNADTRSAAFFGFLILEH